MKLIYKDSATIQPIKIIQKILQITCYSFLTYHYSEINALMFRYYSRYMSLILKDEFCLLRFEDRVLNVESQYIDKLNCEGQKLKQLPLVGRISQVICLSLLLQGFSLFNAQPISC